MPKPMSPAERQRNRRRRLKDEHKFSIYVQGKDGLYDERIQIGLAIQRLAQKEALPEDFINTLLKEIVDNANTASPHQRKYIAKIIKSYLEVE